MNNVLFSGDFVFKGTIGNYPDGMEDDMVKSLNVFKYMPSNVEVYPGHGPSTTVKEEVENNPFLRGI
jgi:glyoxylase-like metal-dependent hydrolase (beta-lactamase superfamily II)